MAIAHIAPAVMAVFVEAIDAGQLTECGCSGDRRRGRVWGVRSAAEFSCSRIKSNIFL